MSRRLYYEDPYCREFEAMVVSCQAVENGYAVELTETAFYPGGGGQPCDRGSLGGKAVLSMEETKDERILHIVPEALQPGTWVQGRVDFAYRYDFMQQHTGEHVLSGVMAERYGVSNTGFHISLDPRDNAVTVDFSGKIPREDILSIEQEVNRLLWQGGAVKCWYPDPEMLKTVPYRSKKELPWPVRIVEVAEADCCACCGLHVANAAEVGFMKIISAVPFRGGTRMEVVWGNRALAYVQRLWEDSLEVSKALSAKMLSTGQTARELAQKLDTQKRKIGELERKLQLQLVRHLQGEENPVFVTQERVCENEKQRQELTRLLQGISEGYCTVLEKTGEDTWSICMMSRTPNLKLLLAFFQEKYAMTGASWGRVLQGSIQAPLEEILNVLHSWMGER